MKYIFVDSRVAATYAALSRSFAQASPPRANPPFQPAVGASIRGGRAHIQSHEIPGFAPVHFDQ
ncbi:hypothetical protein [Burkholderia ubonensis]|uniref:hypothetical protein n=1 Tax=Burkholderia ubonensis TaxID=101571 RepID=UPI002AB15638|nr:hypothetical protein [Burkholderia ubonensis]